MWLWQSLISTFLFGFNSNRCKLIHIICEWSVADPAESTRTPSPIRLMPRIQKLFDGTRARLTVLARGYHKENLVTQNDQILYRQSRGMMLVYGDELRNSPNER